MKVIAIEEHCMTNKLIEAMDNKTGAVAYIARHREQITDLGFTRLKDMDAGGIDLQ